jgi:calcium-dependent protein kinase
MGCGASKSPNASEPTPVPSNHPTAATLNIPPKVRSPEGSLGLVNSHFTSSYRVLEETSRGPGFVCKKVQYISSNLTFNAKFLSKKLLKGNFMNSTIMRRELLTLKSLTHPNLVKIIEFYDDEKYYIVVQEHCPGGPLFEKIGKNEQFSEVLVKTLMHQLFSAVRYCHERRVLHRDLSADTVLLAEEGSSDVIKVTDFGSLSFFDASKQLSGRFGSVYYGAPEVFQGLYDEQCDMWSCGVIMHILLLGFPPFQGVTDEEVRRAVSEDLLNLHDAKYSGVSDPAKDLMHRLLIKDPIYRIKGAETLAHPWFQSEARPPDPLRLQTVITGMSHFRNICKLKDAIFNFICTHMLSIQDYKELRQIFESVDQNGDGTLSREEIKGQLANCLPASTLDHRLDEIFQKVDSDHNGHIDYEEFIKATIDVAKVESKEVLRRTFQMFDKDSNGYISCEELKLVLETAELDDGMDWSALLKEADTNGDGVIDMMEFEALIQRKI